MRKITMTLAAALFVLGSMAVASAQTQAPGAASLHGQAQNATIIHKAACGGAMGSLVPAGKAPRLRPLSLLVRSPVGRRHRRTTKARPPAGGLANRLGQLHHHAVADGDAAIHLRGNVEVVRGDDGGKA